MRIFNGTDLDMNLPFNGSQRLSIGAHSVSGDILPSSEFITTIITSYNTDEIALIITGQYELNLCANIPTSTAYVVQSLDEAISRFKSEDEGENCCCMSEPDLRVDEEEVVEKEPEPEPTPAPKKKKSSKK